MSYFTTVVQYLVYLNVQHTDCMDICRLLHDCRETLQDSMALSLREVVCVGEGGGSIMHVCDC